MAKNVVMIPALSMDRIDHKRVAAYTCFASGDVADLRDKSLEMRFIVKAVYVKPKWKLAQLYWDYEPGKPMTERRAYKDFVDDASGRKIDILYMWSIRQLSHERKEIEEFLALLRKYNITLRTHIEEIDSSIISDNLILDLWFIGMR